MKRYIFLLGLILLTRLSYGKVQSRSTTKVVLSNEEFLKDTTIVANKILIQKGNNIRVRNSSTLFLEATEIEIEGPANINARCEQGEKGFDRGDWCSPNFKQALFVRL